LGEKKGRDKSLMYWTVGGAEGETTGEKEKAMSKKRNRGRRVLYS